MNLGDHAAQSSVLIRDRDRTYTAAFDSVFAGADIRITARQFELRERTRSPIAARTDHSISSHPQAALPLPEKRPFGRSDEITLGGLLPE